jgi:hypothetical protein
MNITDLEKRLRAAYAAAGRQVDSSEQEQRPAAIRTLFNGRRPRRLHWLTSVIAAAAVAAIAVTAYAVVNNNSRQSPIADPGQTSSPRQQSSAPAEQSAHSTTARSVTPSLAPGAEPQIGVHYAFQWYVHCGMDFAEFGGRSWRAEQPRQPFPGPRPLPGGGGSDNGYLVGTMTLLSHDTLRFDAASAAVLKPFSVTFTSFTPTRTGQGVCA